jgi:3',5'-cyclic AMP phosphodiesterase CpdA
VSLKKIINKSYIAFVSLVVFLCLSDCSQESLYPTRNSPSSIDLSQTLPASGTRLAIMGDSQLEALTVFADIEQDIAEMSPRPDAVVHLGDMIANPGSGVEWDAFHRSAQTLTDNFPFYSVPGNHDVIDLPSQEIYRHQFGAPVSGLYYDVEMGDLLLIFLDSEMAGEVGLIADSQYDWLKNTLEQKGANFKYRLAFVHYPLFPSANHVGQSLDSFPEQRDRLHQLFVQNHVNIVFNGHEHIYDRKMIDGVTYITSGGAGGILYGDSRGFYHFVFLAETGQGIQGFCFAVDGTMKDRFLVQ